MKRISKWVCNRLIILLAVFTMGTACGAAPTPTQPPAQSLSGSNPTHTPALAATQHDVIPTLPPSPMVSLLPTPTSQNPSWQTFSHHNGVSLQYPAGWDVIRDGRPEESDEFHLMIHPKDGFHVQVIVTARMVPKTEEHTLYHYAGEVIETQQMGPYQTVWNKQLTSQNHLDWHLAIRGFSPFTGRYDRLAYIAQAGGLTEGTITAIHYDAARELAILISKDLDRDMLIALHEAGPDAVYPALVPVFEEILQSVSIAGSVQPGSTSTMPPPATSLQNPPMQIATPIVVSPPTWPTAIATPHPGALICTPGDSFFACEDSLLGIYFEYPKAWGVPSVEFVESPGFYSYVYNYYFENFGQFYAQAGGRGRYVSTTGRGRMLTDFNGYNANFANTTCLTYSAVECKEIQPGVLYLEQRPNASSICHSFENYSVAGVSALAFVGINLPDHEQITGFIFAAPILPETVQSDLLSLLDSDGTMSGCQDPDQIARFDTEVEAFYTSLNNQTADPALIAQYQQVLHLAHSIRLDNTTK